MKDLTVWTTAGRIVEVESREQAMELAAEWWEDYQEQGIFLSWIDEEGQEHREALYDGRDPVAIEVWMEIMQQARQA